MSGKLVIVESPAKSRTIGKYLGRGFKVMACKGHIRDLPPSKMGVDIEAGFEPTYAIIKGSEKIVAELKKAAKDAEQVYLATDLDREGEAISWHLAQAINLPEGKARRVVFNEITKEAVRDAFDHPGPLDLNKVNAQQARRILDRIVGYELSPLLWRKVTRGLSAGRVQSVAVMLVVDREKEIEEFKAEEYWELEAELKPSEEAASFRAKLERIGEAKAALHNQTECAQLLKDIGGAPFVVTKVAQKQKKGNPSPPFITSRLQQAAWSQLRFSTKETMRLAQQLYEGVELGDQGSVGLITYMRTDSVYLSPRAVEECREVISQQFGESYVPAKPRAFKQSDRAQAAHEAIRPTSASMLPDQVKPYLNEKQQKLYELIWNQFVASQMAASVRAVTEVEISAGSAVFGVQGAHLVFDGHEKVSGPRDDEKSLPALEEGQTLLLVKLDPSQHFTQPPPRFTEGSLVQTLERLGIGRPSTYAPIISTIQDRGYVRQEQRRFYPTPLGRLVTDELRMHFPGLLNVEFTSRMEQDLDRVEEGAEDWRRLLDAFYGPFHKELEKAMSEMKRVPGRETQEKCEKCGKPMLIRSGAYGLFLGCSGYPECKNTKPMEPAAGKGQEEGAVAPEGEQKCEKCGKPLVQRRGRRGPFYGCSGYPDCDFTKPLKGAARPPAQKTDIKCDLCGELMVIRTGKRGKFLGCSGFPKCRNTKPLPEESVGSVSG
jgi:DNA topoisomerase I